MIKIAEAINSFAREAEQTNVQLEEPIFVLTSSQIQKLIIRTILEATEPLIKRIDALEVITAHQDKKIAALEATQDIQGENQFIQLRLIADLRKDKEPQPLQKDRGEILRALIAANGGKMLAKEARQKMHLDRATFSRLLPKMKYYIEVRPYHLKKNQKLLVLKSKLVELNNQQD